MSTRTRPSASTTDVAQHAEVVDGEHRHLGVGHVGDQRAHARPSPRAVPRGTALTTSPPACARARCCISASRTPAPRCARRAGRRRPPGATSGTVSVARRDDLADVREHRARAARRVDGDTGGGERVDQRVGLEQLVDVRPHGRRAPPCIRRCDSSVPSPSRSTHWVAWSRW